MSTSVAFAAALATVAGAVVAVSGRDPRTATLGLLVTLLGLVFVADPLPAPPVLAVRLVAAVLAGYLLWIAARESRSATSGSALAWPSEALLALAGAVVGWVTHGLGAPGRGPEAASAAGVALLLLAAAPILLGGRDAFRVGVGASLLLAGTLAIRAGLAGTPGPVEQTVVAALTGSLGATVAVLVRTSRRIPRGAGPGPVEREPGSPEAAVGGRGEAEGGRR